jgi:hypothetical protein
MFHLLEVFMKQKNLTLICAGLFTLSGVAQDYSKNPKTEYNPYNFSWHFRQYDPKFHVSIFVGGLNRNAAYLDYAMRSSTYYPPLYWAMMPSFVGGGVRDYVEYIIIDMYKDRDDKDYILEYSAKSISGHLYHDFDIVIPASVVERILSDTHFEPTEIRRVRASTTPLRGCERYGVISYLGAQSLEELAQPQQLSGFKFMVALINVALKSAGAPELLFDENDLKTKLDFRKKWLSWGSWVRF